MPGRPKNKKNSGERSDQKCETEHRKIERNLAKSRDVSWTQGDQTISHPNREEKAERSSEKRQHKPFKYQLLDDLSPSCSNCRVNRKFSRTRSASRGKQVCQVRAGNQQHQPHCTQKQSG